MRSRCIGRGLALVVITACAAPGMALAQPAPAAPSPSTALPAASQSAAPSSVAPSAPPGAFAYGPPPAAFYPPPAVRVVDLEEDRPGPGLRNAGIGLTLGGLALGAIGGGAFATLDAQSGDQVTAFVAGTSLCVIGGAMLLTGVPLWIVGASRLDSSSEDSAAFSVGPGSASVRGKF